MRALLFVLACLGRMRAPVCECCGEARDVRPESARTMYTWDGKGEDPNRDLMLCRECAIEHHRNWDAQWAEYYGGLL